MQKLSEFFDLMDTVGTIRRDLVSYHLLTVAKPLRVEALRKARERLGHADTDDAGRLLFWDDQGHRVPVQADYEIDELEKDLVFFEQGEDAFFARMEELHPGFSTDLTHVETLLCGARPGDTDIAGNAPTHRFHLFITDRDGTVNNYCARYRSSGQAAYNAVFLSRFAATLESRPIILTSAPLEDTGIFDLSVMPDNAFVLAGSKGREYRADNGERRAQELSDGQRRQLDVLNRRLDQLLERPENRIFTLIGSSLQKKYGETTVARQDVNHSVPEAESRRFKEEVAAIVQELNGSKDAGATLHMDDTGRDIEIILGAQEHDDGDAAGRGGDGGAPAGEPSDSGPGRHFDKGDGVAFLTRSLGYNLTDKELLICGDTPSDVPMVRTAMAMGARVTAIFVTTDRDLQQRVEETGARCGFVSTPDALVAGLYQVAKGD